MKKIPTLLVRDPEDRRYVTGEVTPGCEWVLAGEGVPTRKYDGTCTMLDPIGQWWARREVKDGKEPPNDYAEVEHDITTGKTVGWEPIAQSPFLRFFEEARAYLPPSPRPGTYELIGPKINGNPEHADRHALVRHELAQVIESDELDGTISGTMRAVLDLKALGVEGIVWHHPDGRMAKLKGRDVRPTSQVSGPDA